MSDKPDRTSGDHSGETGFSVELEPPVGSLWKSALFPAAIAAVLYFIARPAGMPLLAAAATGAAGGFVAGWRIGGGIPGEERLIALAGGFVAAVTIQFLPWPSGGYATLTAFCTSIAVSFLTLSMLSPRVHRRLMKSPVMRLIRETMEGAERERLMQEGPPPPFSEQEKNWADHCRKGPWRAQRLLGECTAPAIRLVDRSRAPEPAREGLLPCSRLGGHPPGFEGFAWPVRDGRAMNFLAVLNLEHIAACRPESGLPHRGLLLFFLDWVGFNWGTAGDEESCRVIHLDGDPAMLRDIPAPGDAECRPVRELVPWRGLSLRSMALESAWADNEKLETWLDDTFKACILWQPKPAYQIGGWPENVRVDVHVKCAKLDLAAKGVAEDELEGMDDGDRRIREAAAEWQLLLQIDSDTDFAWGDGVLHFMIRAEDLSAGRFDRVLPSI